MRYVKTKDIIQTLGNEGIPLTRKKFNYYSKRGLLFAPEVKRKRRLHEGVESFYAEEMLGRLRKIFALKEKGYSLTEIRDQLREADREYYVALYAKAGIPIDTSTIKPLVTIRWMNEGYYKGLVTIYENILQRIRLSHNEFTSATTSIKSLEGKVVEQLKDTNEVDMVLTLFDHEKDELLKKRHTCKETFDKIKNECGELEMFLEEDLDVGTTWNDDELHTVD
jgi:DNA-binding transcriptional MerR regulator